MISSYPVPVQRTSERKRIIFVSGTRADFGKLKPLIAKVNDSGEFEYQIFVTGMHMLARYGSTVNEVIKAGFTNIFPFINQDSSVSSQMDMALANTIIGLGHYVREFQPDLIVVHGDRVETLAGAIVGALNNILVAHVEGGEVSGTVDELIRHSVSKLSHMHFVANEVARRRLIQMGELPERVYVIGSPDIDIMLSEELPTLAEVQARYDTEFSQYAILLYHPVTIELHTIRQNANHVLDAALESGLNFVVLYPNNDTGSEVILEVYERLRGNPRFRVLPSMRFEFFLTLLKNSTAIIGNSSAGIREAPVYGVPTVNIGSRQINRFHYPSIVNVQDSKPAILAALSELPNSIVPSTHFGTGESAKRFMEHLHSLSFWETCPQKQFREHPENQYTILG